MKQGNDRLATYSNNLKKIWEELNCLEPRPRCVCTGCSCDVHKKQAKIDSSNQVMQFLMGLNDSYSAIVSNILLLDPLPTFNKAYSIISRVERQKNDYGVGHNASEGSALAVRVVDKNAATGKGSPAKKDPPKKGDRFCVHCNKSRYLEEACFKKHGYPEWFKEYKNQGTYQNAKPKKPQGYANMTSAESVQGTRSNDSASFSEMIQHGIQKYVKGKDEANAANASYFAADFAGTTCSTNSSLKNSKWIVDYGASNHISGDLSLFSQLREVKGIRTIFLPDGSVKRVKYVGDISLNFNILLKEVLYIPEFQYNLMSVHKLALSSCIQFLFDMLDAGPCE